MTIFAILMPSPQPNLARVIATKFPNDSFQVGETQWLVSTNSTVIDLCATLEIYDVKEPNKVQSGNAIVFAISSYFGRAPSTVWDWIKVKLEGNSG